MKRTYSVIALMFSAALLLAQVTDEKAKALLDAVKTKYTAYNSIQVDFKMTLIDKASEFTDVTEGKLDLKKNMFKLDLGDNEIMSNGKDLWIFLKSANQVQIQKYDKSVIEQEFGFAPNEIFTINKDDFDYRVSGEKTINGKLCTEIELTPKDKEKFYYKVKLYVVKSSNEVILTHFYEKDGIEYQFEITNQSPNANLSDAFFIFDKSEYGKELQIEDLRD
ncbi:MAG: outer membrane lipoprotein carrier protein LolA [Bacteroidia bacterium]